jgi:hypothetical protein
MGMAIPVLVEAAVGLGGSNSNNSGGDDHNQELSSGISVNLIAAAASPC